MSKRAYHDALVSQLRELERQVVGLKLRLERAEGIDRIRLSWEIQRLVRQQRVLQARLCRIAAEKDGLWEDLKADIQTVAFDLAGAIERWIERVDASYATRPLQRQAPRSHETSK